MTTNGAARRVRQFTLDNGLRLVTAPAATPQVAAVNLWYGVGSRHELPGRTGFAHLFEHLMFQGSGNVAKGEHFDAVERLGGDINASTSTDRTNYYETVPEHALDLVLWLEADRLATLREGMSQEVLDNQRDVVKNERRQRYDNQPYGTALERILRLGYPEGHPYHHSTIGSMADLDAADLDYVLSFHKRHYGPDNAVLTVVSNLDPQDVRDRVERYFGGIPARPSAAEAPDAALTGPVGGPVRDRVVEAVPAPGVFLGYRVAPYGDRDFDVLHLASAVLGQGQGSRLYRRLVLERGLAADDGGAAADLLPFRYTPSLMLVNMIAREGVSGDDLEAAMIEETEKLAEGITDEELERARAVLERDHLQTLSHPSGLADSISACTQLFGDPELAYTWPQRWAEVTTDDIVDQAKRVLVPENMLSVRFDPDDTEAGERPAA
ncbi:M16 family metallopeptidase [Streptomonospora nanhaiensis]|uniref:M16 family metallopeptidase n=1 Tax=Streptomonospora nanhaiensis TaxID=1323731 RepID=UPI001C394E47|nr:pitrilysin family protein [Streptomonospora nanhaiensis]MBV2362668.1 insulinase family protein [Streptomonospora nanhaiensis]MBX9387303.1 insulinase family protein [Streptomonospora nanhaiensis]